MSTSRLARFYSRLSEKATKLRQGDCPKFDIRSLEPITNEDKNMFEQIKASAGWEELSYSVDGKDHVVQFRMPSIKEVSIDAIQNCITYV